MLSDVLTMCLIPSLIAIGSFANLAYFMRTGRYVDRLLTVREAPPSAIWRSGFVLAHVFAGLLGIIAVVASAIWLFHGFGRAEEAKQGAPPKEKMAGTRGEGKRKGVRNRLRVKCRYLVVAVGTALSGGPPHGSVLAELPHTALALG